MNFSPESFFSTWASFGGFNNDPVVQLDFQQKGVERASSDIERLLDPRRSYDKPFAERCARGEGTWEEFFAKLYDNDDTAHTYLAALVAHKMLGVQAEVVIDGELSLPQVTSRLGEVRLVTGDLIVRGDIWNEGCLVVLGSLVVDGAYSATQEPISQCIVLGNMSARAVENRSSLSVRGDLQGAMAVYGEYNDRCTTVGGTLRTPVLISQHHFFVCSSTETELTYDLSQPSDDQQRKAEEIIRPELIVEDEYEEGAYTLDIDSLLCRVRDGASIRSQ